LHSGGLLLGGCHSVRAADVDIRFCRACIPQRCEFWAPFTLISKLALAVSGGRMLEQFGARHPKQHLPTVCLEEVSHALAEQAMASTYIFVACDPL
jgi:hypothetical protein